MRKEMINSEEKKLLRKKKKKWNYGQLRWH